MVLIATPPAHCTDERRYGSQPVHPKPLQGAGPPFQGKEEWHRSDEMRIGRAYLVRGNEDWFQLHPTNF